MKALAWILIFVAAMALWWFAGTQRRSAASHKADPKVYAGIRDMVLHTSREKLTSIPQPTGPNDPWGAVMDCGINAGTATIVALGDGTVSIYLSSGGG